MISAIFLSRILGLVREMVASYYFGAEKNLVADCYRAAFSLPDLLYFLIAGGALSSAFIPVFTEYLTNGEEEDAWKVYSVFGTTMVLGLGLVILLGEIFAEPLIRGVVAPGFPREKVLLTASLTRIVLPAQLCFFIGGLMMSTLYARHHFLMPALGPVVYNAAIIVGGVIGGAFFGPVWGIYGMTWGVLTGALIGNVLMQLAAMRRLGVRYRFSLDLRHPGVQRVSKLMLPVLLGLSLPYLHLIIARSYASYLRQGSITWLTNANMVMQIPLGIFAQALAVAIFPTLSTLAAKRDMAGLREQFSLGLRFILFLTIPASVLVILLAHPLIHLLFERGRWTSADTIATAQATVWYALAVFALSGQQIVNRGFYALQDTLTPMLVGTVATFLYMGLNLVVMKPLAHVGLAMSFSAVNTLTLGVLLVLFHRRAGGLRGREVLASLQRIAAASAVLGAVAWAAREGMSRALGIHGAAGLTTATAAALLLVAGGLGLVAYAATARLLRAPEAELVWETVRRRLQRRRPRT
ncbi:MAG: murein biosynthesis integral membrane protein MurJ [Armatimonadetes bacterium]|nr:murein biosynthesis integral membrane protein MurJ [Armatimonadota bacterium]